MASRNFNTKHTIEHKIVKLHLDTVYKALIQASGVLDITADITLTKAAGGAAKNTQTFKTIINAAAANPTSTVLVTFSGSAAAIVCTITPNDGTNNTATPVTLTTAEVVELINSGVVVGKTITLTDASSLRALQTASGGGATAIAHSGEADNVIATFAGGQDQAFANVSKWGIASIAETSAGLYRVTLNDTYPSLKFVEHRILNASAVDMTFQIKAETVATTKFIDIFTLVSGVATVPANNAKLIFCFDLKNTTVL